MIVWLEAKVITRRKLFLIANHVIKNTKYNPKIKSSWAPKQTTRNLIPKLLNKTSFNSKKFKETHINNL